MIFFFPRLIEFVLKLILILFIIIILICGMFYCLDLNQEYIIDDLIIDNTDLANQLNSYLPVKWLDPHLLTIGGEQSDIPYKNQSGISSTGSGVATASTSDIPSEIQESVNELNKSIDDLIKQATTLKNRLVVFASKNKILLQINNGILDAHCPEDLETTYFIKKCLLETKIEALINAQVKAEIFEKMHGCKVSSIEQSKFFFQGMLRQFPIIEQQYLNDLYQESVQQGGNRFIHDPLNRPEGFDPVTDRTPSPDVIASSSDNPNLKRIAQENLQGNSKIQKTITEEIPKDIFKK